MVERKKRFNNVGIDLIDIPSAFEIMKLTLVSKQSISSFIPITNKLKALNSMGLEDKKVILESKIIACEKGKLTKDEFLIFLKKINYNKCSPLIISRILRIIKSFEQKKLIIILFQKH